MRHPMDYKTRESDSERQKNSIRICWSNDNSVANVNTEEGEDLFKVVENAVTSVGEKCNNGKLQCSC